MMGDGIIELQKIRGWVEAAGYSGFAEVEIFSDRCGASRRTMCSTPASRGISRWCDGCLPGLVPGIHSSSDAGARGSLDPATRAG